MTGSSVSEETEMFTVSAFQRVRGEEGNGGAACLAHVTWSAPGKGAGAAQ
ncbi:hypothetical protein GCM10010394_14970 [Streptomyces crystallinus]|uniref:Uncharacterized protein n=1 Tax=Streptomyces crystallinus TaxID=68191 RepID=A0ABN1FB18_9ACTN